METSGYIAHHRLDGVDQPLKDHLEGVAVLAEQFASSFAAGEHARMASLLHDAGKYSEMGQRRMRDPEHTAKVDHSTAGAKIAMEKLRDPVIAAVVAGHHGGLMNLGGKGSAEGDGTLFGRCLKKLEGPMAYHHFFDEMTLDDIRYSQPEWLRAWRKPFAFHFYTRMLYSCLADAD